MMSISDKWADWLIRGRFEGQTSSERERMLAQLEAMRDRVLAGARLSYGDAVLDAGSGTGLLAAGALDLVGEAGRVIGVDVSRSALDELRLTVDALGVAPRVELLVGSVLDLPLPSASVDAVVDRSVLIYVDDKPGAAREYFRVLRPGGRLSIFEPINADRREEFGFDIDPVRRLHQRVEQRKRTEMERVCRSMINFHAPDLVRAFETAGFVSIELELADTEWTASSGDEWRRNLERAPNPLLPPTMELVRDVLDVETDAYLGFMSAGVDRGGYRFVSPGAFVSAQLPGPGIDDD